MLKKILIATLLTVSTLTIAATSGPVQAPNPGLFPLHVAEGNWTCEGHYRTSPFTAQHDVTAAFHVAEDVGAGSTGVPTLPQWFVGHYQEIASTNGQVIGINDTFTLNAGSSTTGTRTFADGNRGRFSGDFALSPQSDGSLLVQFSGMYHIVVPQAGPIDAPFTEQLLFAPDGASFTTDSQVFGVTFHTQTCTRL